MDSRNIRNKSGSTVTIPAGTASDQEAWIRKTYPEPEMQRRVMAAWMVKSEVGTKGGDNPQLPRMEISL